MKGMTVWISIKIFLFVSLVYILVLIPPGSVFKVGIVPLLSKDFPGFILGLGLLLIDLWLFLFSAILIPGLFWRVMNLRYTGEHILDVSDKTVRNWLLTHMIYIPTAVTLDLFHLYPLKALHVRIFGGKLGKDVVVGGLITDPSLIEADSQANIGGFSLILGHAVEQGKVLFEKVSLGKYCGIGVKSIILPGSIMEENSFLGAQSLLPKKKIIPRGEKYGGVPAKKIVSLILCILSLIFSHSILAHSQDHMPKNVVNMNVGAAVVAGLTYHRFHIPLNYQRVIKHNRSMVIGFHPAFPLDKGYSAFAFGTSFRIRYHKKNMAPAGLWGGWGIFAFFQSQKNLKEDRSELTKSYEGSMIGPLIDIGYAFHLPKKRIIIEPFVGVALPLVIFKKNKTQFFNVPFPWAGLCIGYTF